METENKDIFYFTKFYFVCFKLDSRHSLSGPCYRTKLGSACLHLVKPMYWQQVAGKKSMVFIAGHQVRSPGQLALKIPELPDGFRQVIFKGQMREGHPRVFDQFVHNSLIGWWWGQDGANDQSSIGLGLYVHGHQIASPTWWGLFSICKTIQETCIRYCYI